MTTNAKTWWENRSPDEMEKCSDHFDFWSEDWKNLSEEEQSRVQRWLDGMEAMQSWSQS